MTHLHETAVIGHLKAIDPDAGRHTPAADEVQTLRLLEEIAGAFRCRTTFMQTDVTVEVPAYRVAVGCVNTLVQCLLSPAGSVEHFQDGFHLFSSEGVPSFVQLIADYLLKTLMCLLCHR